MVEGEGGADLCMTSADKNGVRSALAAEDPCLLNPLLSHLPAISNLSLSDLCIGESEIFHSQICMKNSHIFSKGRHEAFYSHYWEVEEPPYRGWGWLVWWWSESSKLKETLIEWHLVCWSTDYRKQLQLPFFKTYLFLPYFSFLAASRCCWSSAKDFKVDVNPKRVTFCLLCTYVNVLTSGKHISGGFFVSQKKIASPDQSVFALLCIISHRIVFSLHTILKLL